MSLAIHFRIGLAVAVVSAIGQHPVAFAKGKAVARTTQPRKTPGKRTATEKPVAPPSVQLGPAAGAPGDGSYAAAIACQQVLQDQMARLGGAVTGLYVADAKTGDVLFSHAETKPLNPASNIKLISTAAALALLGPDFRYATRIVGAMPSDGVVHGGIYLRGNYDPTLDLGDVTALADGVYGAGVRKIEGPIYIGNPAARDAIYGAGFSVRANAGKVGRAPTLSISPALPGVVLINRATTTGKRRGALTVRSEAGVDDQGKPVTRIIVTGSVRKGRAVRQYVAPKHVGRFTAEVLKQRLVALGVEVSGPVEIAPFEAFVSEVGEMGQLATDLALHESAPLASIIATVNKRSVNWLADRVIYTAAAIAADLEPTRARGVEAMYGWLASTIAADRRSVFVDTGSGLSYESRISAAQIGAVLRSAAGYTQLLREGSAQAFRDSLAVGGQDGTLRARFKNDLRGRVIGKTGTLNPVIALSGFLSPPGAVTGQSAARELVFVIVSNELRPRQHGVAKAAHERMVKALADYLDGQVAIATDAASLAAEADAAANALPPAPEEAATDELPTNHPADTSGEIEETLPEADVPADASDVRAED